MLTSLALPSSPGNAARYTARMPRRRALFLTLGSIGLAAAVGLGVLAAWPSPRRAIRIDVAAATLDPLPASPAEASPAPAASVPAFAIHLDLPATLMRGRSERLVMRLEAPAAGEALAVVAGIVSAELSVRPSGESGQAFGPGAGFAWTATAARGSRASATLVLRVRRAAQPGGVLAERLLLARDVTFPVRSAFGLSASAAGWTSGGLALVGVGLLVAAVVRRAD